MLCFHFLNCKFQTFTCFVVPEIKDAFQLYYVLKIFFLLQCNDDSFSLTTGFEVMSSQQQLGLTAPLGEIDHVKALSENLSSLLVSENYYDITLVVEGQKIPAHKVILASRSEYFR